MELVKCDKYYDLVLKQWPELTRTQLDKIVKHGLYVLYLYNLYGADVILRQPHYTMYFGKLFKKSYVFLHYWKLKWKIKLRLQYKKAKTKYDGYYYFGLTEDRYKKLYLDKYGKPKRTYTFENLYLYKIKEECLLDLGHDYIFKVKYPEDCGFKMYKKDWKARDFQCILIRNKDKILEPWANK